MATPDFYKPGRKATAALERLMKFWEVERKDCTPMEKAGFTMLKRRGLVQNRRGTYLRPEFNNLDDLDAWFDWLEDCLGVAREAPLAVNTGEVDTQRNTDGHIGQQVESD